LHSHFEPIIFLKITLVGITLHTGGQVRKKKKKKNNSMIKVALAKFGHDKENQKDPNDFSFSHKQLR
jgi:hypothetical protein